MTGASPFMLYGYVQEGLKILDRRLNAIFTKSIAFYTAYNYMQACAKLTPLQPRMTSSSELWRYIGAI